LPGLVRKLKLAKRVIAEIDAINTSKKGFLIPRIEERLPVIERNKIIPKNRALIEYPSCFDILIILYN
jgi:hypothetical protein